MTSQGVSGGTNQDKTSGGGECAAEGTAKQTASLATVKAPYSGRVRRVKWLGQSPDGSLSAEITLMIAREK
jgi:hypothetical protein